MGGSFCGNAALATFVVIHVGLLFFACIHWENWWSILIWAPCVVAFVVPGICYNYNSESVDLMNINMDAQKFRNLRDLGWTIAAMLLLVSYLIPVLAWYNTGFDYWGVVTVFVSITALVWVYLLWLRIFVFQN